MREEEKPFGIKILFLISLLAGIFGLYEAIFASDELIRNIILDDEALAFIGTFFNNVSFMRIVLMLFAFFNLWFASAIISLKRIACNYLLFFLGLVLLGYILILIIIYVNNIPLDNMQKIGIAFRIIVNLCWFIYVMTVQGYFVN